MREGIIKVRAGRIFPISGVLLWLGSEPIVLISGGTPHIGAVAISIARPSIINERKVSESTSVFTVVGHKDDEIAVLAAKRLATLLNRNVVVIAGIHFDNITQRQISLIKNNVEKVIDRLVSII